MARWLEIAAHYGCNNRCIGCFSVRDDGPSMAPSEIVETLRYGREQGAESLWLGGGEPTLRRDLFATVAAARRLGYSRVKLQTNGMLLAYAEFTRRCVESGVTEVNFSIKGSTAATHDNLSRTPGCWDLMMKGIAAWQQTGLPSEGDLLLYRSNLDQLSEMVRHYHSAGVARFNLWMFSPAVHGADDLRDEMPRMQEVVDAIRATLALRVSDRSDFITSLHTPACTLRGETAHCLFSANDLDMIVANPGGHRFRLEESAMEGGTYVPACTACSARSRCNGLRAEYVACFGDAEIQPLP